jgi:hypothetical protein
MKNNYADNDAQPKFARATAAAGLDAVVTIAANAVEFWVIDWITWSYSNVPTAGKLTVTIGGTVVWEVDVTVGGPGHVEFTGALYGAKNQAVVVTLANGAVTQKVNVRYR